MWLSTLECWPHTETVFQMHGCRRWGESRVDVHCLTRTQHCQGPRCHRPMGVEKHSPGRAQREGKAFLGFWCKGQQYAQTMCTMPFLLLPSRCLRPADCSTRETASMRLAKPTSSFSCAYWPRLLGYLYVIPLPSAISNNPVSLSPTYNKHTELPGCCSFSIRAQTIQSQLLCPCVCPFFLLLVPLVTVLRPESRKDTVHCSK